MFLTFEGLTLLPWILYTMFAPNFDDIPFVPAAQSYLLYTLQLLIFFLDTNILAQYILCKVTFASPP